MSERPRRACIHPDGAVGRVAGHRERIWRSSSGQILGLAPREGVGRSRDLAAVGGLCPAPIGLFRSPSLYPSAPFPWRGPPLEWLPSLRGSSGLCAAPPLPASPPFPAPLRNTPWPFCPHFAVGLLNGKLLRFLGKYIVVRKKQLFPGENYTHTHSFPLPCHIGVDLPLELIMVARLSF